MAYARASRALGECDRCGFTYKLKDLRYEIEDKVRNGLRVCEDCFDVDHPQLQIGEVDASDPQSLFDSRIDKGESESTTYFSFNPIGGGLDVFGSSTMGLKMVGSVGKLTVST
tara:strand:- start:2906 stop:3244 length:339 start_codon:yes stop_codon:yes gene_type:complete